MPLGVNGTTSVPQGSLSLLTDLSLLSDQWGTYPQFIEKYRSLAKESYILMNEASGAMVYSPTQKFTHFEPVSKDLPFVQAAAGVTGAAPGADTVITLTAGSHTGAGARSPIAVGFVYENNTTGQVYKIVAVDKTTSGAHTATLRPSNAADTVVVEATDYLLYRGNVLVPEGSDESDGLYRETVGIENFCRIIRSDKEFTDLSIFEKTQSPEGGFKFKDAQMEWERTQHFIAVQEMDLMFGKTADNLGTSGGSGKGLVDQIQDFGSNLASGAAIDAAFWDGLKRYFDADGYSDTIDYLMDTELQIKINAYLRSTYNNGSILYVEPEKSSRPMDIASNFRSYDIDGIKYNFLRYHYFNTSRSHGVPLGVDGQYSNFGILIPVGEAIDRGTGQPMKRLSIRYQAESEGMAPIKSAITGLFAPIATDGEAVTRFHNICYKNVEAFGLNGFGWTKLS